MAVKAITQETIDQIVDRKMPERLSLETRPPITDDHAAHMLQLIEMGQTSLAADHLLLADMKGKLTRTVSGMIWEINILFAVSKPAQGESEESFKERVCRRGNAYEALMEMALNLYGLESRWLDEGEKAECLSFVLNVFESWEALEKIEDGRFSIASSVLKRWLACLKRVQKGNSMVACAASRIEASLTPGKNLMPIFLKAAEREIKGNIYYRMVKEGKCKFGNDYALGLRWLRHLGFEQVSTNPVLAARAYQDEPQLIEVFREELQHHPNFDQWSASPLQYAEEVTLFATLLALWDNLHVFRPIFFNLRETSGGGVVSFQLNPNIAHLTEESIRDVFKAFFLASENLTLYDRYLLAGYRIDAEKRRPNMVIKVAACHPAARIITRTINAYGFGSNITLDYSVSQEATLMVEEMEGMAIALRKGIQPTQLYMTNMGGRLESHLREVKLEGWFDELKAKIGEEKATAKVLRLSESNGTRDQVLRAKTYKDKVRVATRYAQQKTINAPVWEALEDIVEKESLQEWERSISYSGTLVARRVWGIFFSEKNRERWVHYLMKEKGLARKQAQRIIDRIHYLPASKRKPFDTYWTLSSRNMVHTEFPDHQENVRKMAEEPGFDLKQFEESISHVSPKDVLDRLAVIEDFQKSYELHPELAGLFEAVGIAGDFGLRGLRPEEWPEFGPVQKTLTEFKAAYDSFQKDVIDKFYPKG